jgi:hypothetical protein
MCANCSAVKFFLKGINVASFMNLSTIFSIALYLYPVTSSLDLGKLVIKSIAISF